jgi:hypothetical protein
MSREPARSDATAGHEEGVERLVAVVGVAASGEGGWEARLSAGLRAGLELLAVDPPLARLLLVESLAVTGEARLVRERSLTRLAEALRPPVELTGGKPISDEILRLQAHGLVSYASGRVLDGEAERLLDSHGPLLEYLLAPLPSATG